MVAPIRPEVSYVKLIEIFLRQRNGSALLPADVNFEAIPCPRPYVLPDKNSDDRVGSPIARMSDLPHLARHTAQLIDPSVSHARTRLIHYRRQLSESATTSSETAIINSHTTIAIDTLPMIGAAVRDMVVMH